MKPAQDDLKRRLKEISVPEPDPAARRRAVAAALAELETRRREKKVQGFVPPARPRVQKPRGGAVMKTRRLILGSALAAALAGVLAVVIAPSFMTYRTRSSSPAPERTVPMEQAAMAVAPGGAQSDAETGPRDVGKAPRGVKAPKSSVAPEPHARVADLRPPARADAPRPLANLATPKPPISNDALRSPASTLAGKHQPVAESLAPGEQPIRYYSKTGSGEIERSVQVSGLKTKSVQPQFQRSAPDQTYVGRDRFENVDTNPVRLTREAPVSTFSIDVDTASYAFVRRALNHGALPPKSAVRVEELINYFDYDYPLPRDPSAPFRPTAAVFPTPWNPDTRILHIGIKGFEMAPAKRPRANLVFLIDVSGSMNRPDKLPLLRNALRMLVETLEGDDTVAMVVYAGSAGTVIEPTPVRERGRILEALDNLRAGGSTAGGQGIRRAYALAEASFDPEGVNRVILATDGDFNVGIRDPEVLKAFVERKRRTGIYLSVLGFGQGNYNDALMQKLAQNGNGNAAYIDTLSEARKVLVDEAVGTLFAIAKDVKIQVEFNPARVAEYRLIGYETRMLRREDFNNDRVDAGEVGAGHSVTALYEIAPAGSPGRLVDDLRYGDDDRPPPGTTDDGSNEVAFIKIRYKLPNADASRLINAPVGPAQTYETLRKAPAEARFAAAVAGFGQLLRGDPFLADFSYDRVLALAQAARGPDRFGYRAEFIQLLRLAQTARAMGDR